MYKDRIFTSATDYKNMPDIRIDSRRLIGAIFAVILSVVIFFHDNKAHAEAALLPCSSLVDAQGEE